ncbi:MAG: hypothetical protein HGB26_02010, partial [Desulfobulbaceae bacterium]|nr:hypothetical protein [Desulfobulbaceae bacterium]
MRYTSGIPEALQIINESWDIIPGQKGKRTIPFTTAKRNAIPQKYLLSRWRKNCLTPFEALIRLISCQSSPTLNRAKTPWNQIRNIPRVFTPEDTVVKLKKVLVEGAPSAEMAARIRHLTPPQLQQQTFVAIRELVTAKARQKPL